jgi:adenylate kinase family enzyme
VYSRGDRKRPEAEIEARFASALHQPHFILEDAGRERFEAGMARADAVILLDPPRRVRRCRILKRWIKQRLGLESCVYRPTLNMLRAMFRWSDNYDSGRDGTKARAARYRNKLIVLRTHRDVERFLQSTPEIANF